jgi:CRISPR-associated protein Cas2
MADKKTWIIAYDVREPGRLVRVHKYLAKRAFALQYSVFAADLSDKGLAAAKRALSKLINEREDDVRFYAAPVGFDVRTFGTGRLPKGVYVFGEGAADLAGAHRAGHFGERGETSSAAGTEQKA